MYKDIYFLSTAFNGFKFAVWNTAIHAKDPEYGRVAACSWGNVRGLWATYLSETTMVSHNVPLGDHGGRDTQTSSLILISGRTFDPRSVTTPEQSRPSTSGSSRWTCFYKDNKK